MADILIKNMEMPTKVNHPLFIRISSDGHIVKGDFLKGGFIETEATAIELPLHGRLVDIDRIIEILEKNSDAGIPRTNAEVACLLKELAKYSTIVEASNE